jgi:peptide/nickel transport system substrate-binding protein
MRDIVYGGHGLLGNDLFGITDALYDHSIPQREQDLDQAQALLRRNGLDDVQVTLTTAPFVQAAIPMATILKEQASSIGVTINIDVVSTDILFGPNQFDWQMAQSSALAAAYLRAVGLYTIGTATQNYTHFNDPRFNSLYDEALATVDVSKRGEIVHEMQRIEYDTGGTLIPFFDALIDGYAPTIVDPKPARNAWGIMGQILQTSFK